MFLIAWRNGRWDYLTGKRNLNHVCPMFYKLSLITQTARAGWRHIFRAAGLWYGSIWWGHKNCNTKHQNLRKRSAGQWSRANCEEHKRVATSVTSVVVSIKFASCSCSYCGCLCYHGYLVFRCPDCCYDCCPFFRAAVATRGDLVAISASMFYVRSTFVFYTAILF